MVPDFRVLVLVRVLDAGGSGIGWQRGCRPGCSVASAVGVLRDAIPVMSLMPELHLQAFRAPTMIMASLGRIEAISGHDHEQPEPEGAF
jgi:hypothetical protein